MLSRKLACAIMILNELHGIEPNVRTGSKVLRRADLVERVGVDAITFRRVMQRLTEGMLVGVVNSYVMLICDPEKVTIYDLFHVLYGGIPLGEEKMLFVEPNFYVDKGYHNMVLLEADVAEVSKKYFKRLTVASMMKK